MIMMGYWISFDAMKSLKDPNQTLTRYIVSQTPAAHTINKHKLVVDFSASLLPLTRCYCRREFFAFRGALKTI